MLRDLHFALRLLVRSSGFAAVVVVSLAIASAAALRFSEYEDLLGRSELFRNSVLSARQRKQLFEAFLSVCECVQIYYGWRPNLRDEADNHLLELAIAGGASSIATHNVADFGGADLQFPQVRILSPREFIKELA